MFVCVFPPRSLYLTKKEHKIVSEVQTSLISVPSGKYAWKMRRERVQSTNFNKQNIA